jgi:photosystem II stability/assembly factor-like uncharacterized protein
MKSDKAKLFSASFIVGVLMLHSPLGASAALISHVHQIDLYGHSVLLGTHEGLMKLGKSKNFIQVGKVSFDVMGLATTEKVIYASGHPLPGDSRPSLLGLLASKDGGLTWSQVSLKGKADFHLLVASSHAIAGGDSASGDLFYSTDNGFNWVNRGKNIFEDIALSPTNSKVAFGISGEKLMKSADSLKTWKRQKISGKFSNIVWAGESIYLSSGSELLSSRDAGKTWKRLYRFSGTVGALMANSKLVAATVGNDIYQSRDGGSSFELRK